MNGYSLAVCALLLALIGAASYAQHPDPAPAPVHRTVDAPPDTKVVGVLWEHDELYVVVRPMRMEDVPEQWTLLESSPTLVGRTEVTVRESRLPPTTDVSFTPSDTE